MQVKKVLNGLWLVVSLSCLTLPIVNAQEHIPVADDYEAFKTTKTYFVLDQNPMSEYNFKMKEIVNENKAWKLTPYEFITEEEFEQKRKDPSFSFVLCSTVTFDKDKTKARYNFLTLVMGKDVKLVSEMPELCALPLSYTSVDEYSYSYKLEGFLNFIQAHVLLVQKDPSIIRANVLKYYNKNIKSLKGKTLYLVASDLTPEINTIEKIKKVYKYDVKIVSTEEIEKAIADKEPNVVYLHKVGPEGTKFKARCYKVCVGAGDNQIYYFDYHMIDLKDRDGLLESDLKSMN